jgi:hypothetical protein
MCQGGFTITGGPKNGELEGISKPGVVMSEEYTHLFCDIWAWLW